VVITLVLLPALLPGLARGGAAAPDGTDQQTASTELVSARLGGAPGPVTGDVLDTLPATVTTTTTTTTTAPPPTTTTTVPKPRPKAVAKPPATTTTSTTTPARTAVTTPPVVGTSQTGRATWYVQQAGVCAHRTLEFGTVVTVTADSGGVVTCTVGDRGPFVAGLIIDLAPEDFEQLAPTSVGVLAVTITW